MLILTFLAGLFVGSIAGTLFMAAFSLSGQRSRCEECAARKSKYGMS